MGKTFVRGKEKYSLAEKKRNLESWLKNTRKNMIKKEKPFVIFLCKRCLLGQTKRKGTLLTIFRPPGYSNPLPPLVIVYTNFQPLPPSPCLLEPNPPHRVFGNLEYINFNLKVRNLKFDNNIPGVIKVNESLYK